MKAKQISTRNIKGVRESPLLSLVVDDSKEVAGQSLVTNEN